MFFFDVKQRHEIELAHTESPRAYRAGSLGLIIEDQPMAAWAAGWGCLGCRMGRSRLLLLVMVLAIHGSTSLSVSPLVRSCPGCSALGRGMLRSNRHQPCRATADGRNDDELDEETLAKARRVLGIDPEDAGPSSPPVRTADAEDREELNLSMDLEAMLPAGLALNANTIAAAAVVGLILVGIAQLSAIAGGDGGAVAPAAVTTVAKSGTSVVSGVPGVPGGGLGSLKSPRYGIYSFSSVPHLGLVRPVAHVAFAVDVVTARFSTRAPSSPCAACPTTSTATSRP